MIKGVNAVLNYFDQVNTVNNREYKYFSIYKKGTIEKGNPCITTPNRDDWTYDQARDLLSNWLSWQQYGEFIIVMNDSEKATARGNQRQEFGIENGGGSQFNQATISGPQFSAEDIQTKINDALNKYKNEQELETIKKKLAELEKEKKELEKQAGDPWNKFIGSISPYIPAILKEQGIIKETVVAGVPASEAKPVTEQDAEHPANDTDNVQQRLETVVGKFHQARPDDWLEVLEFFADKILAKPSLVETAKSFL